MWLKIPDFANPEKARDIGDPVSVCDGLSTAGGSRNPMMAAFPGYHCSGESEYGATGGPDYVGNL